MKQNVIREETKKNNRYQEGRETEGERGEVLGEKRMPGLGKGRAI